MSEPPRGASGDGRDDRRELLGWALYQWAFHGFVTTVATVLLGPYLTALAQKAVGPNGAVFGPGRLGAVTAKAFFPYCLSASVLLQLALLPFLGAIADRTRLKKPLLVAFSSVGATATCLLFLVGGGLGFVAGGLLFVVANLSFGASVVLYNAFLPEIASDAQRDRVSSLAFALGYLSGGILLAANLVFLGIAPRLGVDEGLVVRLCFLSAGLWWGGFSVPAFRRLRPRPPEASAPPGPGLLRDGLATFLAALRELGRRRHTRRYLVAYLLYNDGIQTVIGLASVFLAQELFVARRLPEDRGFLLGLMLMVQFVGFGGALLFGRLAARFGSKPALLASLAVWTAVVVYGWRFLRTPADAIGMSVAIALVLGGSQALSRSLFSRMIPPDRGATFFALYEVAENGTSWIGPTLFGAVVAATSSYRDALLSLVLLLVSGTILLAATDLDAAFGEAQR
ncbi:MAG TPA: MFS transporter [Vicinamibacteria bacterium]|nr:MFS transporter [Vicinamibacteria bacterium]